MLPIKTSPKFLSLLSRQKVVTYSSQKGFFENLFFPKWKERDYGAAKTIKIKSVRVLLTSFDKFNDLCNLYIFGFCFVVPQFRFKLAEMWRFFNLNNKIATKKYSMQE